MKYAQTDMMCHNKCSTCSLRLTSRCLASTLVLFCVCVCVSNKPAFVSANVSAPSRTSIHSCVLQCSAPEFTLNIVLDRSYVLSRETLLQERMPLHQKCDTTAQRSDCTGIYGKMHAALEAESNTTPWRVLLWYWLVESKVEHYIPLVPFRLLIPQMVHCRGVSKVQSSVVALFGITNHTKYTIYSLQQNRF